MITLRVIHERHVLPVVIEDHGSYVVTADLEDDPPQHSHFDYRDAPEDSDDCPRCQYDTLRAEE